MNCYVVYSYCTANLPWIPGRFSGLGWRDIQYIHIAHSHVLQEPDSNNR